MTREDETSLNDGVVRLRQWRPDDAPAVFAACQDQLIARFIPIIPQPYTEDVAREFVDNRRRDWEGEDERPFAITDAVTDEVLGSIARHARGDHRAEFGYWLAPWGRGRGVATRALRLITDWTVATTGLIRLELYTDVANDASGRVAERAGFVREGVRRAWDLDREGRPLDAIHYVRIRDDVDRWQEEPRPIPRPSARVVMIDEVERILLVRFWDRDRSKSWWATPGGSLEAGETHEAAAIREVREETGLIDLDLGPWVWTREHLVRIVRIGGLPYLQRERLYIARVSHFEAAATELEDVERASFRELRWWTLADLAVSREEVAPRDLVERVRALLRDGPAPTPITVGM